MKTARPTQTEIDQLTKALQDSIEKARLWKLDERGGLTMDENSFAARESYDDVTRGTFDVKGRVRS